MPAPRPHWLWPNQKRPKKLWVQISVLPTFLQSPKFNVHVETRERTFQPDKWRQRLVSQPTWSSGETALRAHWWNLIPGHLHCLHRTSVVLLQPVSQRNGKRRGTKRRNEISAAALRLKKTSFHLNSTRDTVFSVVSCAYRLHNKLNQLWGKISSWLFCVLLWVFFPRTGGGFSKSHILAFPHFKRLLIHIQPQRKISISVIQNIL